MKMEMVNRLPRACVYVEYGSVSLLVNTELLGELLGGLKDVADQRAVFRGDVVERRNMLMWADQQMNRSLWAYVLERENDVVIVNLLRRRFALDDPAKEARRHGVQATTFCVYGRRMRIRHFGRELR